MTSVCFLSLLSAFKNQDVNNDITKSSHLCTSLASITVPTPTVKAIVGTFARSFSKNRALATIVSFAKVLTRVRDTSDEPGSLNAIWPSLPIPVTKKVW